MLEREWLSSSKAYLAEYFSAKLSSSSESEGKSESEALESISFQWEGQKFNLMVPNSACPVCKAPVKAWQNIPVLSYLILKGRCNGCKTPISIRYPIVELITAILGGLSVC